MSVREVRRFRITGFLARSVQAAKRSCRRLVARSWTLSRWRYRWHGLELQGKGPDLVWYFAYGSNMHDSAFRERRRMRPLEWRVGRLAGYRLRFNLDGTPKGRSAPANICADAGGEVWGVLYRITRKQMVRLNLSEGVPGGMYRPTGVSAEDVDGNAVDAMAYIASGCAVDGRPSHRYIRLLREGARAHGLPAPWLELLDSVVPAERGKLVHRRSFKEP